MKTIWSLVWIFWLGFFGKSFGQNYSTLRDGDWSSQNVWKRQTICPAPNWGSVNDSNHPQVPPTSSSWPDCAITVTISHQITKSDQATFSSKFKSLKITQGAKLNFVSNKTITVTNNSYGAVELIVDGGTLEVYDLEISNGAKLKVINGGRVIVRRNLSTGGNSSLIELDATSSLEVKNEFKLAGSSADVKLSGTFSATTLTNTGSTSNHLQLLPDSQGTVKFLSLVGSTTSTLSGKLNVTNDFTLEGSASASVSGSGTFTVNGSSEIKSSTSFPIEGNAQLKGDLTIKGNASVLANGNLLVGGITNLEGSASIGIPGFATFEKDVILKGGGTHLQVSGEGDVLIKGDLAKPQYSGSISVLNKGQLVICNDRVNGTKSGAYPPTTHTNMNIAPSPAYYGGCRILPVEFADFEAQYIPAQRAGVLTWSTLKEWENSHFEIERSVNDVKSWEVIGKVEGAGYSETPLKYSFEDKSLIASGGSHFYRIKQVDFNGKFIYSNTEAIQANPLEGSNPWTAYPVPSTRNERVEIKLLRPESYHDEPIFVTVSSMTGLTETYQYSSPSILSRDLPEAIKTRSQGIYILKIQWGDTVQQLKLIIQ
ncbi:T9SS type A sorting domain-containing protein [Algoriphagus litoralis]|uniref:T9SS type A sorting domain-containing protein n=1 Tax=Algoriphagus litoralis TaxID=2202829 RepID=UPI000DB97EED|nr:T9SS type A sorting domain-containing protein [Algoriphagus litoralis]